MIRQEAYEWIADTFGTSLAVAEWEGDLYPKYKRIKDVPEDLKVIALTNFIINRGIYQQDCRTRPIKGIRSIPAQGQYSGTGICHRKGDP